MDINYDDICSYMDYIMANTGLYISLHGDFIGDFRLARYNFHLNPFCSYIKTVCGKWDICIDKQKNVISRCADGEFFGCCHAGVGEYIYPIRASDRVAGFISVSGYATEEGREKFRHFCKKYGIAETGAKNEYNAFLNWEIPPKKEVDTVVRPLRFMLEKLCSNIGLMPEDDLCGGILRYISENHGRNITLSELSEVFNYSVSTISHVFSEKTGQSIGEYIKTLRLDEACWLLRGSDYTISHISDILGFCSQGYFSDAFRKKYGVSPLKYRKNERKQ